MHNVWVPTGAEILPEGMPALPLKAGQQVHALCREDESDVVAWPGQGCVHMVSRFYRAGSAGWRVGWKYSKFSAPGVSSSTPLSLTGGAGHLTVYWAGDGRLHAVDVNNQTGTATVGPLPLEVPVYRGTPVHAFSGDGGSAGIVWAGGDGLHHARSDGNTSTSRWSHVRLGVGLPRAGPSSSLPLSDLQEKVLAWALLGACLLCVGCSAGAEDSSKGGEESADASKEKEESTATPAANGTKAAEKDDGENADPNKDTEEEKDDKKAGKKRKKKAADEDDGEKAAAAEAAPAAAASDQSGRSRPSCGRRLLRCGLALLAALLVAPLATFLAVYEKTKLKLGNGVDFPGSLQGFSVMITGSSSGMGFEAARYFYILGADVVMHGPSENRTRLAAERVVRAAGAGDGQGSASAVSADLSDFGAVRQLADEMRSAFAVRGLNALVLNAAAMYSGEAGKRGARTAQRPGLSYEAKSGHDFVMAANHLGHFLLATELATTLAPKATVVVLTGSGAWHGDFDRLFQGATARIKWEEDYEEAYKAYYDSKLANVCFSRGLRRWLQKGSKPDAPRVVLFDPGRVHTAAALQRNSTEYTAHSYAMWHDLNVGVMKNGLGWRSVPPQDAGWHLVMATFASVSPEPDLVSTYFFPRELFWWYADTALSKLRTEQVPIAPDGTPYWAYVNLQANAYQTFSWGTSHMFSSFGPNCGRGVTSEREHWRWSAKQLGMNPDTLFW
jgi:NAD(P)-dependent dehydrogenase (short-subunit alcohol dehydrogenase family)